MIEKVSFEFSLNHKYIIGHQIFFVRQVYLQKSEHLFFHLLIYFILFLDLSIHSNNILMHMRCSVNYV